MEVADLFEQGVRPTEIAQPAWHVRQMVSVSRWNAKTDLPANLSNPSTLGSQRSVTATSRQEHLTRVWLDRSGDPRRVVRAARRRWPRA